MLNGPQGIARCCFAILVALFVVGAVSHGVLRHLVQTLPLWVPIVLGFRKNELAKWIALPCLIFWLVVMTLIWLYLAGLSHVFSGHFSAVEIAMTVIVWGASAWGLVAALRWRTSVRFAPSVALVLGVGVLQAVAMRISFLPGIAER